MDLTTEELVSKTKQTPQDLGHSGFNLFHKLIGKEAVWESADNLVRNRWTQAGEMVAWQCVREVETTWNALAERISEIVADEFVKQVPLLKTVYQAVARHMVNLWIAEDRTDLGDVTGFDWEKWVLEHHKEET